MDDAGAKRTLFLLSMASLVLGVILGLVTYGSLADVRTWNLIGLVYIAVVGGAAGLIALRAWIRSRKPTT